MNKYIIIWVSLLGAGFFAKKIQKQIKVEKVSDNFFKISVWEKIFNLFFKKN
jgi:hypothetical protein